MGAHPPRRHVPDRIGSVEAQSRVEVPAIGGLQETARELDQIGGRGLLGPQAAKYLACP